MKTHILYPNHIITPESRRISIDDPSLEEIRSIHSAVRETLGQNLGEDSARNRFLPHMGDAFYEGRILAALAEEGMDGPMDFIPALVARMQRSRRTLKDGTSTHPMGRFHPSAVVGGLPSPQDLEINTLLAKVLFEKACSEVRPELMEQGLTTYPFATAEILLMVVRPFYPCDRQYLKGDQELKVYNNFY